MHWIDVSSGGNVDGSASDSTSTQFNPVGYVDKLTLTVSGVQSTINFFSYDTSA